MDFFQITQTATSTYLTLTNTAINIINEWFRLFTFLAGAIIFFLAFLVALKIFNK